MLIDTGASATCIALDVAQELGLAPLRQEKSYGAGGLVEHPVFGLQLTINFIDPVGRQVAVGGDIQAKGIPDLGDYFRHVPMDTPDPFPKRMVGLIGRDLLRHATFVYKGSVGQFDFRLDLGSLSQAVPGT